MSCSLYLLHIDLNSIRTCGEHYLEGYRHEESIQVSPASFLRSLGWTARSVAVALVAKFYSITKAGKKQLATETENWRRISLIVERFAEPGGDAW